MSLLGTWTSASETCLFKSFAHFLIGCSSKGRQDTPIAGGGRQAVFQVCRLVVVGLFICFFLASLLLLPEMESNVTVPHHILQNARNVQCLH